MKKENSPPMIWMELMPLAVQTYRLFQKMLATHIEMEHLMLEQWIQKKLNEGNMSTDESVKGRSFTQYWRDKKDDMIQDQVKQWNTMHWTPSVPQWVPGLNKKVWSHLIAERVNYDSGVNRWKVQSLISQCPYWKDLEIKKSSSHDEVDENGILLENMRKNIELEFKKTQTMLHMVETAWINVLLMEELDPHQQEDQTFKIMFRNAFWKCMQNPLFLMQNDEKSLKKKNWNKEDWDLFKESIDERMPCPGQHALIWGRDTFQSVDKKVRQNVIKCLSWMENHQEEWEAEKQNEILIKMMEGNDSIHDQHHELKIKRL